MATRLSGRLGMLAAGLLACACACHAAHPAGKVVYSNDFESGGAGKEWSNDHVDATPKDARHFLGPFITDKITLKLEKLPKHKYIRISLELFIVGTWDGNTEFGTHGDRIGPDSWRMDLEKGIVLVDATFSNLDGFGYRSPRDSRRQSYPGVLPGESYAPRSGAAENSVLGFEFTGFDNANHSLDAIYKMSFLIPHEAAEIAFNFKGADCLAPDGDEYWGLDNVKVEALDDSDLKKLDEAEIRRLWEAIGGHDPAEEWEAFWKLVEGRDDVARFLRDKVKRAGVDKKEFARLVAALDGDNFKVREEATEAIKEMGPGVEKLLRDAIEASDSAEVRLRLETALKNLASAPPADPETRRQSIAIKLLRVIGSKEAQKVAEELAGK
jgi:hypothetical protein